MGLWPTHDDRSSVIYVVSLTPVTPNDTDSQLRLGSLFLNKYYNSVHDNN